MKINIYADDGMILTDGENFGEAFSLGTDRSLDEYTEITKEEYEKIMAEQEIEVET